MTVNSINKRYYFNGFNRTYRSLKLCMYIELNNNRFKNYLHGNVVDDYSLNNRCY